VQANLSCAQRFARFLFATDKGKSPRKILEPFTPTLERLKGGVVHQRAITTRAIKAGLSFQVALKARVSEVPKQRHSMSDIERQTTLDFGRAAAHSPTPSPARASPECWPPTRHSSSASAGSIRSSTASSRRCGRSVSIGKNSKAPAAARRSLGCRCYQGCPRCRSWGSPTKRRPRSSS